MKVRCQVCGKHIFSQAAPYRCKAHRHTQMCRCGSPDCTYTARMESPEMPGPGYDAQTRPR
jgi:hypothetical protein